MAISQGEEKIIDTAIENQNSANIQSAQNLIHYKSFFGPKIEQLTEAINSASKSSGTLSKVIIAIAIIGTVIAALQVYDLFSDKYKFKSFTDKQLQCIIKLSEGQSSEMIGASIEMCIRKVKN